VKIQHISSSYAVYAPSTNKINDTQETVILLYFTLIFPVNYWDKKNMLIKHLFHVYFTACSICRRLKCGLLISLNTKQQKTVYCMQACTACDKQLWILWQLQLNIIYNTACWRHLWRSTHHGCLLHIGKPLLRPVVDLLYNLFVQLCSSGQDFDWHCA